ncbi:P-loop containing nucleoside triphosphate hydrolase protein [Blastocladiella britannica]|nr:P-loop containing nucleoside triphosphate hydrolase protein [Blastocladiella britannica]
MSGPPPPPPPPPLPARTPIPDLASAVAAVDLDAKGSYFEKRVVDAAYEYQFLPGPELTPTQIGLFSLVKALVPGAPMSRKLPAIQLFYALGKLRATQLTLRDYNATVAVDDEDRDGAKRYAQHHAVALFSVLGFKVPDPLTTISVLGLDDLIISLETHYANTIAANKVAIEMGSVEFEGLGELYKPGNLVAGPTSLVGGSVKAGYRVRTSWYEEKRTLFKTETSFHIRMESAVPFGRFWAIVEFEEVYSGWTGAKVRSLADLGVVVPIKDGGEASHLTGRGAKCVALLAKTETPFVEYSAGAFFAHNQQKHTSLVPTASSGRLVIDSERGLLLGHLPSQGSDEATLAMMAASARYKRMLSDPSFGRDANKLPPVGEGMLLYRTLPAHFHPLVWPAVVGFSFSTKAWGHVLVEALQDIHFNDHAFDQLVIAPERKRLIRALVKFGGKSTQAKFTDIISSKSGGSVFLLHGPPGTGKTLTGEAIAELLHKPLYYVTMGELGTTPEAMEQRMGSVLELCAGWDALILIDEADTFLEKRSSGSGSDVVRNAMVCVMLRLLEYHPGIIFLTTNRVTDFDPAFESRVTVALRYDHLAREARKQVWLNLVANVSGIEVGHLDYDKLSVPVMNGRQIKNAVRLALALAEDIESPLTQELVEQTIEITAIGRKEIAENAYQM